MVFHIFHGYIPEYCDHFALQELAKDSPLPGHARVVGKSWFTLIPWFVVKGFCCFYMFLCSYRTSYAMFLTPLICLAELGLFQSHWNQYPNRLGSLTPWLTRWQNILTNKLMVPVCSIEVRHKVLETDRTLFSGTGCTGLVFQGVGADSPSLVTGSFSQCSRRARCPRCVGVPYAGLGSDVSVSAKAQLPGQWTLGRVPFYPFLDMEGMDMLMICWAQIGIGIEQRWKRPLRLITEARGAAGAFQATSSWVTVSPCTVQVTLW